MSICDDYKNNGLTWQRKAHEEDDRLASIIIIQILPDKL